MRLPGGISSVFRWDNDTSCKNDINDQGNNSEFSAENEVRSEAIADETNLRDIPGIESLKILHHLAY